LKIKELGRERYTMQIITMRSGMPILLLDKVDNKILLDPKIFQYIKEI
jgi:hypothetical protein